jgi:hypothetical protein
MVEAILDRGNSVAVCWVGCCFGIILSGIHRLFLDGAEFIRVYLRDDLPLLFYRMIRPVNQRQGQKDQVRTVEDVFVSGRTLQEVEEEVLGWIKDEGIRIEAEREVFVRGRLGIPSELGLTAPKYFEVSFKSDQDGVMVHTEGWVSVFDISERSFSKSAFVAGGIPRRKGWIVIEHLWKRLRIMSK